MTDARDPVVSDRIHDAVAASYPTDVDVTTSQRLKAELPGARIRPRDRILDVGCGNGLHLAHAIPTEGVAVGVDRSAEMLRHAREALPAGRVLLVRGDAQHLPFRDGAFDLTYSFSMVVIVPDASAAVAELARVTKPTGTVIVDLAGRWNLSIHAWRWWYRRRGQAWLHAFGRRQAAATLRGAGLEPEAWHASGFADQWKYVPLVRRLRAIDRLFHEGAERDRDYRLSNLRMLAPLANRWYVVTRKQAPPPTGARTVPDAGPAAR